MSILVSVAALAVFGLLLVAFFSVAIRSITRGDDDEQ